MGWSDIHLNRFHIHGQDCGVYHDGGINFDDNPERVLLSTFGFRTRERFLYEYDFGDAWLHEVRIEKRLPLDPKRKSYPVCIDGKNAAPPEDCGLICRCGKISNTGHCLAAKGQMTTSTTMTIRMTLGTKRIDRLNPEAEHLLDWFHVTMRLTVLHQIAKGLPMTVGEGDEKCELREPTLKVLESIKWYLWHGNTYEALQHLETLEADLDGADAESRGSTTHKLLRAVEEFQAYIANNQAFIPNYGERYRQGDRIAQALSNPRSTMLSPSAL